MATVEFFDESTEQSQVKSEIVSKYFWAWAKVIIPRAKTRSGKIAYIDLFAGPGRYNDGTKSTPLLVLERAIQDPDMRRMLVTMFNDKDEAKAAALEKAIRELPSVDTLKYQPKVNHEEVGQEIARLFEGVHLIPTLFFVDPWGYKGLSLRLINSVLKDWGCDCIIFFNYNRINMGLDNEAVRDHMDALFGSERAANLREKLRGLSVRDRELTIVEEICQALKEGEKLVLPFVFKNDRGSRTSHHLIFVSKSFTGYKIMKDIMARESSSADQGVPSFTFSPADRRFPNLFELSRPLDDLEEMLLADFAGQRFTTKQIYEKHSVGRRYIEKNYRDALRKLEDKGAIKTHPPAEKRRRLKGVVTFGPNVVVQFPKRRR